MTPRAAYTTHPFPTLPPSDTEPKKPVAVQPTLSYNFFLDINLIIVTKKKEENELGIMIDLKKIYFYIFMKFLN